MIDFRRLPAFALLLAGAAAAHAQDPAPPAGPPDHPPGAPAAEAPAPEAKAPETPTGYIRSAQGEDGILRLELATRTFAPASGKGPTVQLVSAVHLAEEEFYKGVQERLSKVELVLFEGVRPSGGGTLPETAGAGERTKATRRRLEVLRALAGQAKAESGAWPADLAAVVAGADRAWKNVLPNYLVDGWGRPIRYALLPPGEVKEGEEKGAPAPGPVLTSDGPDGKPDAVGADAPGDDLRVEVEADAKAPAGVGRDLYSRLGAALGLTPQFEAMDSSRPNWRSSDMSLDELQDAVEAAGGDITGLFDLLSGTSSSGTGKMVAMALAIVEKSPKMAAWMKIAMIQSAESGAGSIGKPGGAEAAGFGGVVKNPEVVMRVILEGRNQTVLRDLRAVIEKEPAVKSVAVFYGAGHMEDLERRLTGEMGYVAGEWSWHVAVRADPREAGMTAEQVKAMTESLRRQLKMGKPEK